MIPANRSTAAAIPGEKLVWSGQPKQGVRLAGDDLLLIPFSLDVGRVRVLFREATVLGLVSSGNGAGPTMPQHHPPLFFRDLGHSVLSSIGLYMVVGRFF